MDTVCIAISKGHGVGNCDLVSSWICDECFVLEIGRSRNVASLNLNAYCNQTAQYALMSRCK